MNSGDWKRVKELFDLCHGKGPAEREEILGSETGLTSAIRQELESLLKEADLAPGFLEPPPVPEVAGEPTTPGQTIGRYVIGRKLGEGGMGTVWQASDLELDRIVALKFLAPHLNRDSEARRRLVNEARAAARLSHPNICAVHEIVTGPETTFIAMEYLDGITLEDRLEEGAIGEEEAVTILRELCKGLQAAHSAGVVHRDIKPGNAMLCRSDSGGERVVLMDFGVARIHGLPRITKEHRRLGTAAYMSPEQAQGGDVDHKGDIWSLGVVLYEICPEDCRSGGTPTRP